MFILHSFGVLKQIVVIGFRVTRATGEAPSGAAARHHAGLRQRVVAGVSWAKAILFRKLGVFRV